MAVSDLPPGFVLDSAPAETGLPAGFVMDKPSFGEDLAKSAGAGLENAAIGTVGALGDMRSLASRGVDAAGAKFGFDPSTVKTASLSEMALSWQSRRHVPSMPMMQTS